MGGPTHVNPPASAEGNEVVDSDIVTDANPSQEAKVIDINTPTAVSEPVIDELAKPEGFSEPVPTEKE